MLSFAPAKPEQAFLKCSMYGGPGTGKTYTTLLMAEGLAQISGKRIAYIDTERGTDFYALDRPQDPIHPKAFEFDAVYTRSLSDMLSVVRDFDTDKYGVLICDSITHGWQSAIEAYGGKMVGEKADKIPIYAWNDIKRPYKELIDLIQGLRAHTFLIGRQKNVWDVVGDEWTKAGVAMKAEGDTQYEPHLCLHMTLTQDGDVTTPVLFAEKDRTSCIAGRTFPKPSFTTIEPILALLGDVQAQPEDTDGRVEKDAALLLEQEGKLKKKQEKSSAVFTELQTMIVASTTMEGIGAANRESKKRMRSMTEAHRDALREIYAERRRVISESQAPGEI